MLDVSAQQIYVLMKAGNRNPLKVSDPGSKVAVSRLRSGREMGLLIKLPEKRREPG